jgi:hypothetical protein
MDARLSTQAICCRALIAIGVFYCASSSCIFIQRCPFAVALSPRDACQLYSSLLLSSPRPTACQHEIIAMAFNERQDVTWSLYKVRTRSSPADHPCGRPGPPRSVALRARSFPLQRLSADLPPRSGGGCATEDGMTKPTMSRNATYDAAFRKTCKNNSTSIRHLVVDMTRTRPRCVEIPDVNRPTT